MALVKKVRDSLLLLLVVGGVLYYTQTQLHMQRRSIEASMVATLLSHVSHSYSLADGEQSGKK